MTSPETGRPAGPAPEAEPEAVAAPAHPPAREPALTVPALPEQSREDTDAAWGEYPGPADDRLHRDRPPHWADF